ncbi:MAG TPA: HEPN domain-containing protein [Chitinophagaceae bacterium]|nr:HEPN domain-containing protein [Chitinophagaceae bacterium]
MQSFRTELEGSSIKNGKAVVEKDIIELEKKIRLFREGKMDEEKFRSLRLARGVYGQRQQGVQMVRIKLPYGKMTLAQWNRIADVSDEYSTGNLHLTTRQDIQIHFVSLDRTPEMWNELEKDDVTIREACGNTVRNITASDIAGIDPDEPFDVTPYAHAMFEYFLRKPVCQEMGRKFKIAFSSSEKDTALVFMHDLGVIPRIKIIDGKDVRGFKVLVGGGLGAQPHLAITTHEFLEEDLLIPYLESVLRVFDRHGERNSRHKARIKFLIQKIGIDAFNELVAEEQLALTHQRFKVVGSQQSGVISSMNSELRTPNSELRTQNSELGTPNAELTIDPFRYQLWKTTNVFAQKQPGNFAVYVRVPNGNISSHSSRRLIGKLKDVIADDVRVTINQGLQFRFIKPEHLEYVYSVLDKEGFAAAGFGSVADVTSCPGTDTCNLGISNSTSTALALSEVIEEDFPEFLYNKEISIKISGCMNSCGQHGMASIGFHGSSLKSKGQVLPALQVLIGGGVLGGGEGRIADKVLKVPSKRGPDVIRTVLTDYKTNATNDETFLNYSQRNGERYYYELLKPLASLETLEAEDYIDWGQDEKFATAIGVGECAGVMIDLIATLIMEAEEKISASEECLTNNKWADGIYNAYAAQIHTAKALLLQQGVQCNTQHGILKDFDTHFSNKGLYIPGNFKATVMYMNDVPPSETFANEYLQQAKKFVDFAKVFREQSVLAEK